MATVKRSALVAYRAEDMFLLVDNVESYSEFLPWCAGSQVEFRDAYVTRATVHIAYRGVRQSFTTENEKKFPDEMRLRLVRGPFSRLEGTWRFTSLGDSGCKVELLLEYQFASALLGKLIGPVFDAIATSLVEAFANRAAKVYR